MSGVLHNFTQTSPCERYLRTSTYFKTCVRAAPKQDDTKRRLRSDGTKIFISASTNSFTARRNILVTEAKQLLQEI